MTISQCPKCELKFTTQSEMRWHLREDHPVDSAPETAVTITVARPAPPPPPERHRRTGLWRGRRGS